MPASPGNGPMESAENTCGIATHWIGIFSIFLGLSPEVGTRGLEVAAAGGRKEERRA